MFNFSRLNISQPTHSNNPKTLIAKAITNGQEQACEKLYNALVGWDPEIGKLSGRLSISDLSDMKSQYQASERSSNNESEKKSTKI